MAAFSTVMLVLKSIELVLQGIVLICVICTNDHDKSVVDEPPAKVCEQQQATKDDKKPLVEPMDAVEYW